MKPELEELVACDEKAQKIVHDAEEAARRKLDEAHIQAMHLEEDYRRKLEEVRKREIIPLVSEAEQKAKKIDEDAKNYIKALELRLENEMEGIVILFLGSIPVCGKYFVPDTGAHEAGSEEDSRQ